MRSNFLKILFLFLIIILMGNPIQSCSRHDHEGHNHQVQSEKQLYHCPMHPSYISDKPGECPICGMNLVPIEKGATPSNIDKSSSSGDDSHTAIKIDNEKQQRIGVKTAQVILVPAKITVRAAGRVAFDQDLVVAQREFIEAKKIGDTSLLNAARERLTLMGMSKDEIGSLTKRGRPDLDLVSPEKNAWIYASIYENEYPFIQIGQNANIELPDGSSLGSGTVRAVDPVLDPKTRTARARIEIGNAEKKLRPNMFVNANIHLDLGEKLLVPKSAVIDSGKRKIVFIVHDGMHFEPREVKIGAEVQDGNFVVEEGLSKGDTVATGALFLIDSESQLKTAIEGMGGHKHD